MKKQCESQESDFAANRGLPNDVLFLTAGALAAYWLTGWINVDRRLAPWGVSASLLCDGGTLGILTDMV